MKTEDAKAFIVKALQEKTTIKANEINYQSKGAIALVQFYGIMAKLIKVGAVKMTEADGGKSYTLVDAAKLNDELIDTPAVKVEYTKSVHLKIEDVSKEKSEKKAGRDLTTYKFNGTDYNKTRLSHALVVQVAKDKNPSLKELLEIFPDEIIRPYGLIRPIKEAKEISKDRLRFLIKPEEEIKIRDCNIAVSNQWTPERMDVLLNIAKKLGYKIK